MSADGAAEDRSVLGADLLAGQRPQCVVPAGAWQSARPLGCWTLVGCTVSPPFDFTGFELAPPDCGRRDSVGSPQDQVQGVRAMPDPPDDEQQDDDEGLNDPLTRSDVEAPRMRFGSDPGSGE